MSERLKNKISIVTGACSGFGKSIAEIFAEAGSTVYLLEINKEVGKETEKKINNQRGDAKFIHCDVSDESNVKNVIAKIMKTTLLNQPAGSYTAVIEVCNNAACSRTSVSYVIPDAPNVDDITLTVTITRD